MKTHTPWAEYIDRTIDAYGAQLVQVRRRLHAHPEPSGEEVQTTLYLSARLRKEGFQVRLGLNNRGLIVDPAEALPVPRIGLRADIDALRIQDAKSVDYRSRAPGVMHACGHDGHTATVLGAIVGLDSAGRAGVLPWPVQWRAIFQPAEETSRGALEMIEAGALEGVEALLSLHMDPSRPVGDIGLRTGAFTAACDEMEVWIKGRGGHAARPHESLDPIAAAAQLISSIYLFVPRSIDAHEPVVVTIGQVVGGDNPNVIPDLVVLRGTLRSFGDEVRQRTMDHIQQLARGLAEVSGTRIDMQFRSGPASVYNDPDLTELLRASATDVLGVDHVQSIPRPSMGGEDFANYLGHVPGSMFRLGCSPPGSKSPPLHSSEFDIDERAMSIGAKILARAVVQWSNPARHRNKE